MKILFTIFFLSAFSITYSQQLVQQFDGIPFNINGQTSYAPFNGGSNNARFQFVDIDGDNCLDLFMFDADTSLYYYKNTGTPQNASYKLMSNRFQNLHFFNWFYFADMDNDGDFDLFTGGEFQTVMYFKNTGTSSNPDFKLTINELRTNTDTVVYSESNCVPILCDIDNDGDKDFFTGQSLGTITYFENIGSPVNFSFRYVTDLWQNLLIISPALEPNGNFNTDMFDPNGIFNSDDDRHGANSLEFADTDGDNDFDLYWGDLFSKGIYFIKNNGTPSAPNVAIVDSTYPHNEPFWSLGYNSTRFNDIDNDGDKDLFISVLYLSQNSNNFAYYKNTGSPTVPNFQRQTVNYLNNVDVGGNSNISFVDIDSDGDKDLFIGNDYAKITFYRNTGNVSQPSFTMEVDSLPIISTSFNYSPAFTDIDNDGDMDMMLGSYIKDSLWFFRNTGTPQNFNFTLEARGHQIGLTTLGQSTTPEFADIDNDGDKDLFIGATNGRIFYYRNDGNSQNFNFTYVTNFYNNIDAGDESIPKFFDLDNDGDLDLFIGRQDGRISYYKNEGTSSSPDFQLQTNEYKSINVHSNSCPVFSDIDNDTDPDLFVGNIKGGLYYFRNDDIIGINTISTTSPEGYKLYQNYPNPFNPSTKINFSIPKNTHVKLSVFDATGKETAVLVNEGLAAGTYEFTWHPGNSSSGVYFYRLQSGSYSETKSMLFIK